MRENVALFARAVNPHNRKHYVTICNGIDPMEAVYLLLSGR
jgi:hypothetical protein